MISDEYFGNLSKDLLDKTENFILSALRRIRNQARKLISDPNNYDLDAEQIAILNRLRAYSKETRQWVDENLPKAYLKGLENVSGDTFREGAFFSVPMFQGTTSGDIPGSVKKIIPTAHHTMYSVFQNAAYNDFEATRLPIVRSYMDHIRELVIRASDRAYLEADELTRRQLSQEIMREVADQGITGITYRDGRTLKLDSYAEMVARSQTGNAARQAHINRLQEYGRDLILISQHYPVSPLCEPYQGKVYSLSGTSERFPPFSSTNPGSQLYHANCKHSQSEYTGFIPEAREKVGKKENERRYKAEQMQRYNERQIRSWKRREATALTDNEASKAKKKIRQWQKRQREHIDSNPYLRRAYAREQV